MTKNKLIKALAAFDGDACVIVDTGSQGWANVETVKADGCQIAITMGDHPENRDKQGDIPLTIRDAIREIRKAQRHIEDRYPNSNIAGQAYNVGATVTALRVAHTRLMQFTTK